MKQVNVVLDCQYKVAIEQIFQQAGKALLEAKRSGKTRIYLVGKPQSDITEID